MNTASISLRVPKEMLSYLAPGDNAELQLKQNAMMLYPMIHNLTISYGRAAEILGICKTDLIEMYNSMGIPYLGCGMYELKQDLATLDDILGETA